MRPVCLPSLLMALLLLACDEEHPVVRESLPTPPIEVRTDRMDRDVFTSNYADPGALRQQLYHKYGSFYCDYVEAILRLGPCDSDSTALALGGFATYPDMADLQSEVDRTFTDERLAPYAGQLTEAIRRWKALAPTSTTPRIVFMNSGLTYSAYSTDSVIAVGLDFFLGQDSRILSLLPPELFPIYMKEDMRADYLVVNAIKDFSHVQVDRRSREQQQATLLDLLIYHGKTLFLSEALLPEVEDSTRMNWSSEQMEWAENNEWNTWKEVAVQDVMFSTSFAKNRAWFDYGPFTNAGSVPQESAPQLGIWMGWNIVRAYMKQHPEVGLEQLLAETDAQKILQAYRPDTP